MRLSKLTFDVLSHVSRRMLGGGVVASRDLVGEDEQEKIVERHLLLVGDYESPGEREDGRGGRGHQSASSFFVVVRAVTTREVTERLRDEGARSARSRGSPVPSSIFRHVTRALHAPTRCCALCDRVVSTA